MRVMELVTVICSVIGFGILVLGIGGANGAPQEASAAAMAAALAIIPYTITATLQRRALLKQRAPDE